MRSIHLHSPLEASELDCSHWLTDLLEQESEPLSCIPHGAELPCRQCEQGKALPMLEARP